MSGRIEAKRHPVAARGEALGDQPHRGLGAADPLLAIGRDSGRRRGCPCGSRACAAGGVRTDRRGLANPVRRRAEGGMSGGAAGPSGLPARHPARRHQPGAEHPALASGDLLARGRVPRGVPRRVRPGLRSLRREGAGGWRASGAATRRSSSPRAISSTPTGRRGCGSTVSARPRGGARARRLGGGEPGERRPLQGGAGRARLHRRRHAPRTG